MATTGTKLRTWTATLSVTLGLLGGLAATAVSPSPASAADDGGFAAKMLELVNQHRSGAGLAALQRSEGLGRIAEDGRYDGCGFPVLGRAADMGARNYFSHTIAGCGTQGITQMIAAAGIKTTGHGENIAWMNGTTDPLLAATRLTNDLMASPGHRANIMSPNFTHVGIGSWRSASGQTWNGGGFPLTNVFIAAQVFAKNVSGPSTPVPPPPPALPNAPTAVAATGGDGSVSVTWALPASGPAVDSYGAFIWDASGYTNRFVTVCATCRAATVSGLANGRTYFVSVHGHNTTGWGAAAYSNWVTVAAVPGAPTEVRAVPGNASVSASWRSPTNPGTAIDGHAMFIFDADGYTGKYAWVCATCTTATVTGLVNGRSYFAVVYAHNPNGWGTPTLSEWVIAGTPGPPGNVRVSPGNGTVAASWTAASTSGPAIDLYGIFAYDANGYTGLYGTACATCTTGTVAGLINGRTYTFAVFAHNAFGFGTPTVSTQVVPSAG